MAAVEPADLLDIVQVLLAGAMARVLVMVAQYLQPVLARHVGESIKNSVSWLQGHTLDAERLDIIREHIFIQAFSSFHSIPLPVQLQLPICHR